MSENEVQMPKIEFPCAYPIKVMGVASATFEREVVAVIERHAPGFAAEDVSSRPSSSGNYLSVTVVIQATGTEQLTAMFQELKATTDVKMVL